jgi:hypothetical protein
MNTLMQIITLQNATFNQWTWITGTVIILIIVGMKWDNYAYDDGEYHAMLIDDGEYHAMLILVAFIWPICLLMVLLVGIVYSPIWIGRQLAKLNKEKL